MKARLLKVGKDIKLLCRDGTVKNASSSNIKDFFSNFDKAELFTGTDGKWTDPYLDMTEYPGETLAYVTDIGQLVTLDADILKEVVVSEVDVTKYLTVVEYAKKHNRSKELVKVYAREGRLRGAFLHGRSYFIPEDAPYPVEESSRRPTSGNRTSHNK